LWRAWYPYQSLLPALQTILGQEENGDSMLWAEIGDDMQTSGSPEKHASLAEELSGQSRVGGQALERH
jgi:hypothetical protein